MLRFLYFFFIFLLSGCTVTPNLTEDDLQQIAASTPQSEGEIKYSAAGVWSPNTKEFFFNPNKQRPYNTGVIVITEKSLLFERWGGETGLSILKKIPYLNIKKSYMVHHGLSGMLIILSKDGKYDAFYISNHFGTRSFGSETEKVHKEILLPLLNQIDKSKE